MGDLGRQGIPRERILKQPWLPLARNETKSSTRYYKEPCNLYRIIMDNEERDMRSGASSIPIRSRRPTRRKRI